VGKQFSNWHRTALGGKLQMLAATRYSCDIS